MHFFALEINDFEIVDLSYLTHPDLPLLSAIQMSAAIPMLISPVCISDKCYLDCGWICNYPLQYCIDKFGDVDEIVGLKNIYVSASASASDVSNNRVNSDTNILDFIILTCVN